jgi:hypothetical protein
MSNSQTRYVAVPTVGSPPQVLHQVRQAILTLRMTGMISGVKFEKKAGRGEFYIFLAVEGDYGRNLPAEVREVLRVARLTRQPAWPLTIDEIQPMVGDSEIVTHGLNFLTYRSSAPSDFGDPFDESGSPAIKETDPRSSTRFAQLLSWLSATGSGGWDCFVRACQVLGLEDTVTARLALRRLRLLGHIEVSQDGRKWSVAPTAIVEQATDSSVMFLAGQRIPKLLRLLRNSEIIAERAQPSFSGPPRIQLLDYVEFCSTFATVGQVSLQIGELLPDLERWKNLLPEIDRLSAASYSVEKWDGERYVACSFIDRGSHQSPAGMYRLSRNGLGARQFVAFFDPARQRWLQSDWHDLRFLALHADPDNLVEVVYDSQAHKLLIPQQQRWPLLYEKALVLATGLLPSHAVNPRWLEYSGVPPALCETLAAKLNVPVKEAHA